MSKILITITFLLFSSLSNLKANGLELLTPVEDPFEFQNEYFPLTVGNYWKMAYYNIYNGKNINLKGYYHQTIVDYTFKEIYFGDSLYYIPVFKEELKFRYTSSNMEKEVIYYYLIKTKQGILISQEEPRRKKFIPFLFIPQDTTYDNLSEIITHKKIIRNVNVKTGNWELNCLKIEWDSEDYLCNYLYSVGYGHVLSQFYQRLGSNSKPTSEFVLEEYLIK